MFRAAEDAGRSQDSYTRSGWVLEIPEPLETRRRRAAAFVEGSGAEERACQDPTSPSLGQVPSILLLSSEVFPLRI